MVKVDSKEVIISKEDYAIIKSDKPAGGAFANIIDKNEITVIIKQDNLKEDFKDIQKDFKLFTFNMVLPFTMTGFISKISTALAKESIPIFVISAFTTDHILIKKEYLNKSKKVLIKLGFNIK